MRDLEDMTAQQTGHNVNGMKPHSFEDYKVLLLLAVHCHS